VLPRENEPDLEELPAETRKQVDFVLADTVEDVLTAALDGARPAKVARAGRERQAATSR
jgi:ATP-dependent Lon protease